MHREREWQHGGQRPRLAGMLRRIRRRALRGRAMIEIPPLTPQELHTVLVALDAVAYDTSNRHAPERPTARALYARLAPLLPAPRVQS